VRGADAGLPKCEITRDDALDTTLVPDPQRDGGVVGFVGTLGYTFGQTDDSDCSDQLTNAGGGFAALPCSVGYKIVGNRTALPAPSK
jgi:hypothetical protein